ncbi:hypothetical protein NQZ68_015787 [Dissostichus eleginoides]|nr:hypothetical protein NQZ68_015787 [Dissostichus eleginoides]
MQACVVNGSLWSQRLVWRRLVVHKDRLRGFLLVYEMPGQQLEKSNKRGGEGRMHSGGRRGEQREGKKNGGRAGQMEAEVTDVRRMDGRR